MDDKLAKEAFLGNMLESIGRFDVASIPRAYRKMTVNPLGAALFNAAAVGIPAYFAAKPAARGLTALKGRLMKQSPEQIQHELAMIDQNTGRYKGSLAAALGLLAGGGTLLSTYVPKSVQPETGGLRSWLQWEHQMPDDSRMKWQDFKKEIEKIKSKPGMEKTQMLKEALDKVYDASYKNPLYDHPGVPVDYSLDLIWQDKYLNGREKINASLPFTNAGEGKTGLVSTSDLTRGAVRAGFGLGAGYLAGKTLGTIFGAPAAVTQTLSATGALAGMLKNTGVF